MKKVNLQISSSSEASAKARNLKSIWSKESYLSLQVLIYATSLLEKLLENKNLAPAVKKKRPRSAWQQFLSVELRTGATIQQTAQKWSDSKKTL